MSGVTIVEIAAVVAFAVPLVYVWAEILLAERQRRGVWRQERER